MRPIAETLRKPFWLSLIIVVSLTIFGLIWLLTAGAREIVAAHARVDGSLQKLVGRGAVKGPHDLERIQELAGQYRSLQAKIWAEVWQPQKDLMTWPDAVENRTLFKQMLYARRIQAFRGSIGDGTFPKKLAANQYRGTIKRARADYIVVARPGQPDTVFRNTPSLIVTLKQADKEQRRRFSALEEGDQVLLTYEEGKFFGDELTDREKETYCDSYKTQLGKILQLLDPVRADGQGMILLWDDQEQANWYYAEDSEGIPTLPSKATFFVWIPRVLQPNRLLSREAWTAQEDLWIQRELFTALRSANRQVARFASLGQAAAEPQPSASVTLANPYWKLDLKLVEHGKRLLARVTNRLDRKQPLDGVVFLVRVHPQGPPERLILGGEALPTGASRELPPHTLSRPASPAGILGVEQVLTWEAAAVKRLDYIRIGGGGITAGSPMGSTLSSRMLPRKLVAYPFPVASPENEPDAAKTAKTSSSPNGVVFTRYTEVTRQFRRVPVALSVIVDQNQVSNVLQALSSGRLPLVTHQVFLHRYPQRLRVRRGGTNRLAGEQTARPPGIPAKVPSVYWPDGQGSGLSLPGSAGGPDSAMAEGPATNMELVVYGVVTLFERYPPRTPDGEGAGADAADGDDS